MLSLFLQFEAGKFAKYVKTRTLAKSITMVLFVLVFLFVGAGIYGFFVSGFRYIRVEAVEDIQVALNLFLYEVFLIVIAGIGMFSALISGVFNLYRGGTNTWILGTPGYRFFPKMIFIKSFFTAGLPLFIMFLPAVLALIKVYHLGALALLSLLASAVFFLLTLTSGALLLILGTSMAYHALLKTKNHASNFTFKRLILLLMGIVLLVILSAWKTVANVDLVHLFRAEDVSSAINVKTISSHFTLLPTHPFALEILNWQTGATSGALGNLFVLALIASVLTILWWKISPRFYPLWLVLQEGSSERSTTSKHSLITRKSYHFNGGKTMALFTKEALISGRNWKGVLWFLFLALIWLTQIGANVIMGHNIQKYQPDVSEKTILLQVIQFIIAIYFISSFTLRFVFPSFSVEKKTSWILGTAPLSFTKIFFGKYLFYTIFFVLLGLIMNTINAGVLGLSFMHALYATLLFVVAVIFIVTLGISLGALFPSTETDDPETISTSMSGLFFTALALMYGALADFSLYIALKQENSLSIFLFVGVSIASIIVLLITVPEKAKYKALSA
jgi:hypothetical protein